MRKLWHALAACAAALAVALAACAAALAISDLFARA